MSNTAVPAVYSWIIDDVVTKMRPYFNAMGLPDQTLTDIEKAWTAKLAATGCASFVSATQLRHQAPSAQHQLQLHQQQLQQQQQFQQQQQQQLQQQQQYYQQQQHQQQQQQKQQQQPYSDADFLTNFATQSQYNQYGQQQQQQQQQQYVSYNAATGQDIAGGNSVGIQPQNVPSFLNFQLPPIQQQLPPPQIQQQYRPNNNYGYQLPQNDGAADEDCFSHSVPFASVNNTESVELPPLSHDARRKMRFEIDSLLINGVESTLERIEKEQQWKNSDSSSTAASLANSIQSIPASTSFSLAQEMEGAVKITDRAEKERIIEKVFSKKSSATIRRPRRRDGSASATVIAQNDGPDEDDDDEDDEDDDNNRLGSDLDSNDDDENSDVELNDMILCQYEKVNRVKN
ncbi:hypothetical protein HK100_006875, partial [Physocladia obscura]